MANGLPEVLPDQPDDQRRELCKRGYEQLRNNKRAGLLRTIAALEAYGDSYLDTVIGPYLNIFVDFQQGINTREEALARLDRLSGSKSPARENLEEGMSEVREDAKNLLPSSPGGDAAADDSEDGDAWRLDDDLVDDEDDSVGPAKEPKEELSSSPEGGNAAADNPDDEVRRWIDELSESETVPAAEPGAAAAEEPEAAEESEAAPSPTPPSAHRILPIAAPCYVPLPSAPVSAPASSTTAPSAPAPAPVPPPPGRFRRMWNWVRHPGFRESWERARSAANTARNWVAGPHPHMRGAWTWTKRKSIGTAGAGASGAGRGVATLHGWYRNFSDQTNARRRVDSIARTTGAGAAVGLPTYVVGAWGLQNALMAGSMIPAVPGALAPALPLYLLNRRRRRVLRLQPAADAEFATYLHGCKTAHGLDVVSFQNSFNNEQQLATDQLVNTVDEESLLQGLHAVMWQRRNTIPRLGSVDLYAKWVLPELITICENARLHTPDIQLLHLDDRTQRALEESAPSAATAASPVSWERLRQVSIAYAKFLAKREQQGSEGQITGSILGPAAGLGLALGFTTPPGLVALGVGGATLLVRKLYLRSQHADVHMEVRPDGKLSVDLDPKFFDAGGNSLFTGGQFIRQLEADPDLRTKWLEDSEIKFYYDRILQVPLDGILNQPGALKSVESLAIRATREVQLAVERLVSAKGFKKKGKPEEIEKQKQKVAEIKQTKERLETRRDTLESEISGLTAQKANLERSKTKADAKVTKNTRSLEAVEGELKTWRGQKVELEERLQECSADIRKGDPAVLKARREEREKLRTRISELHSNISQRPNDDPDLKDVQTELGQWKHEKDELDVRLQQCETDIQKGDPAVLGDRKDERERLRTDISTLQGRISLQETEERRLQQMVDDAQNGVEDIDAQIAVLVASLKQKEKARDDNDLKITGKYEDAQVVAAQAELDKLELGDEQHPNFDAIGLSEAASKAFAIRMVEVFRQRKKPSTALKVTKAVLGPAGAVLGDVGTQMVVVPAAAGTATAAGIFVAGTAVQIIAGILGFAKTAAIGSIAASPYLFVPAGIAAAGFAVWRGTKVVGGNIVGHIVKKEETKKEPEKK